MGNELGVRASSFCQERKCIRCGSCAEPNRICAFVTGELHSASEVVGYLIGEATPKVSHRCNRGELSVHLQPHVLRYFSGPLYRGWYDPIKSLSANFL